MRPRTLLIVLLVIAAAGVSVWLLSRPSGYPITNEHPQGTAIIALGDSLTAGNGASADESYPAQLARKLGIQIVNKGVAGDTTAGALGRVERDVLAGEPRIVLVLLGGNDVLQRLPRKDIFTNVETIIHRVHQRGALVILIGFNAPLDAALDDDFRQLARRTGCPFVPDVLGGILGHGELMSDGVHPNAKGYGIMAEKIAPVMRKYIGQ